MRRQKADGRQQTVSRRQTADGRRQSFVICFLLSAVCCLPSVTVAQEPSKPMNIHDVSSIMQNTFGNQASTNNGLLLTIVVCLVVGVALSLIIVERYYRSRSTKNGFYSSSRLFLELCQAHEFTNEQQIILRNIARELQLKNPAVLFIEPRHLELALSESVVRSPQESIRQIYNELFSREVHSSDSSNEDNTWFAWTKVTINPEVDQLKKEPPKREDKRNASDSLTDVPKTQQWDPSLWQEVQQAVTPDTDPKTKSLTPIPQESERTVKEKSVYKPRYPETQDTPVHQGSGDQKTAFAQTPPSQGAQILSSMLYSVSDVTNELAYSSIRNHLTRSLSLSPQTLGEMKQRIPETIAAVPLDEIMVSSPKTK